MFRIGDRFCLGAAVLAAVPCLLTASATAAGQPAEPPPLTLDECVAIALAANPVVLGLDRAYEAAVARTYQAGALPQPLFSFDSDLQPQFFNFKGSEESYVGLSQYIEWPSRRRARVEVATSEAGQADADRDARRLDVKLDVTQGFYQLLLAQARLTLVEEDLRLSESFLEQTRQKVELGDVARVEELRARLEAEQAATAVTVARGDVELGRSALNFLLARPPGTPIAVQGALQQPARDLDLPALTADALGRRPEIRRANLAIEREDRRRRLASLSLVPDLELGVSRHRIAGESTTWDVTFSAPVPLYFWQPKKGAVAEAEASRSAAQYEAAHLRNAIQIEVEQAWRAATIARERILRYERSILEQAEETYEMLAFSYQEGEIGGLDLIAARRTLLQVRQAYVEALFDNRVAEAALDRAVGR